MRRRSSALTSFSYDATCTGTLTASACGSSYDTKLAVYPDCSRSRHQHAPGCNDDSCGLESELSIGVEVGHQYGIRIGGYRQARGTGAPTLTCSGVRGGACCGTQGCSIATLIECDFEGRAYQGTGTSCSPDSDADG